MLFDWFSGLNRRVLAALAPKWLLAALAPKWLLAALAPQWSRLVLWLPVAVACGIAWFFALPAPTAATDWWSGFGAATVVALAAYGLERRFPIGWLATVVRLVATALAAVALGGAVSATRLPQLDSPVLHAPLEGVRVAGTVRDVMVADDAVKFTLSEVVIEDFPPEQTPHQLRITSRRYRTDPAATNDARPLLDVVQGDRILLRAGLFPLPAPAAPGAFDFARYFYFHGIGGIGFAYGVAEKLTDGTAQTSALATRWDAFRLRISEHIRQSIGGAEGAVATALMTGQQAAIPAAEQDAMRAAGLSHVLSISGLHLSLAAGIVFVLLRLVLLLVLPVRWRDRGAKQGAALLALASAAAYLALAGFPVAAQRSYVMLAVVLVAVLCNRQVVSMRSVALAALVLLLWRPESLLSASFQLSFAATLAIVALAESTLPAMLRLKANEALPAWLRQVTLWVLGALMTSCAATVATAPLIMQNFQQFNSYGIVANVLLGPLISFAIMPLVVLAFVLMPLGWELPVLKALGVCIGWMLEGAAQVAHWPYATLATPSLPPLGIALVAAGGLWLLLWRAGFRALGLPVLVAGMALGWLQPVPVLLLNPGKKTPQLAVWESHEAWRMVKGNPRNMVAKQWLEIAQQGAFTDQPLDASGWHCHALGCQKPDWWQGRTLLVLWDAKAPRAYTPRAPKKPDSELTPAQLKRRLYARKRSAEKRAQRLAATGSAMAVSQRQLAQLCAALASDAVVVDLRRAAAQAAALCQTAALTIDAMAHTSATMLAYDPFAGKWQITEATLQRGHWPWVE